MDDVQFNNWKQFVTETLADVAVRQQASEKRMDRFERNLVLLARLGRRARNGLTRRQEEHELRQQEHERWQEEYELRQKEHERRQEEHEGRQQEHEKWQRENEKWQAIINRNMAEITDKLNGLIGHVQGQNPPQ
jgi:hypothetical protein